MFVKKVKYRKNYVNDEFLRKVKNYREQVGTDYKW